MDGMGAFSGSRSEFLRGEAETFDESDIKYQRTGGCFISHKKGSFIFLTTLAFIVLICASMYFYGPRWKDKKINLDDEEAEEALISLLKTTDTTKTDLELEKNQKNVIPKTYEIYIKPFIDDPIKKFRFDGNISIMFQVKKPLKTVILHSKDLIINELFVTYQSSHEIKKLVSANQVEEKENDNRTLTDNSIATEDGISDKNDTISNSSIPQVPVTELPNTEEVNANATLDDTKKQSEDKDKKVDEKITTTTLKSTTTAATVKPPEEVTKQNNNNNNVEKEKPAQSSTTTSTTTPTTTTTTTSTTAKPTTKPTGGWVHNDSADIAEVPNRRMDENPSKKPSSTNKSAIPEATVIDAPLNTYLLKSRMWQSGNKIRIEFDEDRLIVGINYTVHILFNGSISDRFGIVKNEFFDEETRNVSWNILTNFYPNFTQNMFPCINEPWYKSHFQINVARISNKKTLSNMPIKRSQPDESDNGWIWDKFETTPLMSTLSVGFILHDLESKSIPSETGEIINIWGTPKFLAGSGYTTDIIPKLLKFYNTFFEYHYPLSKIDLVALPNLKIDVHDNFGLISFPEDVAMVSEISSNSLKEKVIQIIALALSRQWFGGIVNVNSRNEFWILEGLANYMSVVGANNVEPNWEISNDFSKNVMELLKIDSNINLINNFIDMDDEAALEAVRLKASTLMRMLSYSLTDVVFRRGLRNYIDSAKNDSVPENSLWEVLTSAGHLDLILPKDIKIKNVVDSWIEQDGQLLLSIQRNYEKGTASINQFVYSEEKEQKLILPINYMTAETKNWNSSTKIWIKEPQQEISNVTSKNYTKWVLFNVNHITPCRINYDTNNWILLSRQLQDDPNVIPPINRGQLIDDLFNLAKLNYIDYDMVLNFTSYLKDKEKHFIPWNAFLDNLEEIYLTLYRSGEFGYFQDYVIRIIKPLFEDLGITVKATDTYNEMRLRYLAVKWACDINYRPCIEQMNAQFKSWESNENEPLSLDIELKGIMFCAAVRENGRRVWDLLWERYSKADLKQREKNLLLIGLGCAKESWLIIRYFEKLLNASDIPISDLEYIWKNLPLDTTIHESFEFIRENWNEIIEKYQDHPYLIKTIINKFLTKLNTQNEMKEMTRFFYTHEELKPFTKQIAQAAKIIKSRLKWKGKYLKQFLDSLKMFK